MKNSLIPLALFAWLGTALPSLASDSPAYRQGVEDYQAGRYAQAVVKLARASGAQPNNALTHYCLANALVKCGQHQEAAEEYRTSYMLQPYGSVSTYCREALRGYKKPIPTADDLKAFRDTVGGASAIASAVTDKPPVDALSTNKPLSIIRRQVQSEKEKDQTMGEVRAQQTLANGELQARAVDSWARQEIELARRTPMNPRASLAAIEDTIAKKEQQIRDAAKDQQERIRREARQRAERYKKVAEMRQTALDQVADNLEKQMSEKPSVGGVRLLAHGTDLYVRCYASVPGNRPTPDVHGAVARIYGMPAAVTSVRPQSSSNSDERNGAAESATHSVRGKVLN